jgi:hypothetical protein
MSLPPAISTEGDRDRSLPEHEYRHFDTGSLASSAVSMWGKMIPLAPGEAISIVSGIRCRHRTSCQRMGNEIRVQPRHPHDRCDLALAAKIDGLHQLD